MPDYTRTETLQLIESFIDGSCAPRDWDDFTSSPQKNSVIEAFRLRLAALHETHPSENPREYCSEEGTDIMRDIAAQLRHLPRGAYDTGYTLGIRGDSDDVEILSNLDRAFQIKIPADVAATFVTVGDIYAYLKSHFPTQQGSASGTIARTRARLDPALRSMGVNPAAPWQGHRNVKLFFKKLSARTGLSMPAATLGHRGLAGLVFLLAGIACLVLGLYERYLFIAAAPCIALAAFFMYTDTCRLSGADTSPQAFAEKIAALNFGMLVAEGAQPTEAELWGALTHILAETSTVPPEHIEPDTFLLQNPPQTKRTT